MAVDYSKRPAHQPVRVAPEVTPPVVGAGDLAILARAVTRIDDAQRAMDTARADQRDPLKKNVTLPWGQFFGAVTALRNAADRITSASH